MFKIFKEFGLFFLNEHGFRPCRSTVTTITNVTATTTQAFKIKEYAQFCSCDLRKAFDVIEHTVLLDKWVRYGVKGMVHFAL